MVGKTYYKQHCSGVSEKAGYAGAGLNNYCGLKTYEKCYLVFIR